MTVAAILLLALTGLIIGSFLNVCISRVPAGESVVLPGSRCPSCRTSIAWHDNIPVLSYLLLARRCRQCGTTISPRYVIVEMVTPIAFVLQGMAFPTDLPMLGARLVLTALLVILFVTDLETERLPNVLTLPGIAAGLLFSVFLPPGVLDSLLGVALGGGVLLLIRWGWKRATGVEGMGLGDVKMLAMIGAFLGWRLVIIVLFLSSIAGAVLGLVLIAAQRRSMQTRLPFGTFLAVAAYAASLGGESLLNWYLGLFGS